MAHERSKGTLLQVEIATVLTTISQRTMVKAPGYERTKVPTTDLDSEAHTHIVGIPSAKDARLRIFHDPANTVHIAIWEMLRNGDGVTPEKFRFVYPVSNRIRSFSGFVIDWDDAEVEVDGLHAADITISATGHITQGTPPGGG